MARKPNNYFERRSTELMLRLEKGTEKTIKALIEAYNQATKDINKEINNIFKNYSKDGVLSKETLLQMLNKKETEIHYKNLLKVIDNIADEKIKKRLLAKYNAPAYSYRISRYQALQDNIDLELKKLANIEQDVTKIRYVDTIKEGYYHNIYDIQKGTGLGFSFAQIDNRTINLILNENWINNENFSQRIWNNSEKLGEYLKVQLTAKEMSGKSIQKLSRELADYMNVGLFNATRLVRTEVNHFANEAEMLSYEELDIEKYRFIATLDIRTCGECAKLDNQVFNVKDRKAGTNYPPIHANDRCTTVAELDDDVMEGLERRARNSATGETYVINNMNYQEWYDKYVTNSDNGGIIHKNILGAGASNNFDIFNNNNYKDISYIEKIDISNKEKLNDKILEYRKLILNEKVENAYLIDKKGNVFKSIGVIDGVSFPETFDIEDSIFIHNHPKEVTNLSFSSKDINLFIRGNLKELYGDDYQYSYVLKRKNKINLVDTTDEYEIYREWGKYEDELVEMNFKGLLNDDIDNIKFNYINEKLANKYNYVYERKKK